MLDGYRRQITYLDQQIADRDDEIAELRHNLIIRVQRKLLNMLTGISNNYPVSYLRAPVKYLKRKLGGAAHRLRGYNQKRKLRAILDDVYQIKRIDSSNTYIVGLIMRDGDRRPQSSGFLRLISPLSWSDGTGTDPELRIELINGNVTAAAYKKFPSISVFIVQRTAFSNISYADQFLRDCKAHNIPVFVDLDDAMSLLDKSHSQYRLQQPSLRAMNRIIESSRELWCSTVAIAETYPGITTRVIQNTVDPRLWPESSRKAATREGVRFVYMGTQTHAKDLDLIISALDIVYMSVPNSFTLTVIGVAKHVPARPYIKTLAPVGDDTIYPRFTQWFTKNSTEFDIGLAPLLNTPFNQAKSDIKCMDYLMAGCGAVASRVRPYTDSDLSEYIQLVDNSIESWSSVLLELITDVASAAQLMKHGTEGKNYILTHRTVRESSKAIREALRTSL